MAGKRFFAVIIFFCIALIFSGGIAKASCDTDPGNPFSNCGFETGDFTGWVTQDLTVPFYPLSVKASGTALPSFIMYPTEGNFSAVNGFDGNGPGTIILGQDVSLPIDSQKLTFDYRAVWDLFTGSQSRTFTVTIEPAGGGTPLHTTTVLTAPVGIFDTGYSFGIVDISSFAGQTVRINFNWFVPEDHTGPASFQLDNVSVVIFSVASVTCGANPGNPFSNCGFETGDFTGWVTQDMAAPYYSLSIATSGEILPMFFMFPTEGNHAAVNGFDGGGPGTIKIGQDVTLPSSSRLLTFDYRAVWDLFTGSQSRTFTVTIEPAGGGTPLQTTTILTAQVGEFDTGYLNGSVNVRSFAGQTVRINFNWYVPEDHTGPASFQLDNIDVVIRFPWPMFLPAIANNAQP